MKTLEEIRKQREKNRSEISELKEQAEKAREDFRKMTISEKVAHIKDTPKTERIMREWEEIEKEIKRYQEIGYILRSNYRAALASVVVPALSEVLKNYDGKKAGEKTREKIRADLIAACGCSVWFNRNFSSSESTRATAREIFRAGVFTGEDVDIYTTAGACFIDEDNTIHAPGAEEIKAAYIAEYVDDPAARLEEIRAAREEVEKAKKAYNEAADRLNALTVDGMDEAKKIY